MGDSFEERSKQYLQKSPLMLRNLVRSLLLWSCEDIFLEIKEFFISPNQDPIGALDRIPCHAN